MIFETNFLQKRHKSCECSAHIICMHKINWTFLLNSKKFSPSRMYNVTSQNCMQPVDDIDNKRASKKMHKPNLFRHATRGYERQMIYGLFIEITIPFVANAEKFMYLSRPAGSRKSKIASVNVDVLAFMHVALCFN